MKIDRFESGAENWCCRLKNSSSEAHRKMEYSTMSLNVQVY